MNVILHAHWRRWIVRQLTAHQWMTCLCLIVHYFALLVYIISSKFLNVSWHDPTINMTLSSPLFRQPQDSRHTILVPGWTWAACSVFCFSLCRTISVRNIKYVTQSRSIDRLSVVTKVLRRTVCFYCFLRSHWVHIVYCDR